MTQLKLQEGAMGVVDTVIVFRILKMMTRKWEEMDAFKFGLIDANGKRIKGVKPKGSEQKNSFTLLHRLVFNLKRVLELLPFGRTRLASYAASLALLKEHFNIDGEPLERHFYQYLKENDMVLDLLEGHDNLNNLEKGKEYELRLSVWNEEDNIGTRGNRVQVLGKSDNVMGVDIYKAYNFDTDQSMLITGHDVK
jgi:hypothetical protein|tara:strand:- start:798 stop:1382 length:585 start_codon:yes stop_codon:yes gene_type:complete